MQKKYNECLSIWLEEREADEHTQPACKPSPSRLKPLCILEEIRAEIQIKTDPRQVCQKNYELLVVGRSWWESKGVVVAYGYYSGEVLFLGTLDLPCQEKEEIRAYIFAFYCVSRSKKFKLDLKNFKMVHEYRPVCIFIIHGMYGTAQNVAESV